MATRKKQTAITSTEDVEINSIKAHPKNPRIGDVALVAESLEKYGQYRAIVVNRKNKTIVAGHHTWKAAKELGWTTVQVAWINVDETTHRKIMLMDNKSSAVGSFDEKLLSEIIASIPDATVGTGYSDIEIEDLLHIAKEEAAKNLSIDDLTAALPPVLDDSNYERTETDVQLDAETDEERDAARARGASRTSADEEIKSYQNPMAALQALLEQKEMNVWDSADEWGIPPLREDMLLQNLPPNLQTWGGHEATPDNGKDWFFYNYSLGGTKGLPFDRTILAFNTYDEKFEMFWELPAYYVSKMRASGIQAAVVPDFSFYYTQPRVVHLWNVYRAQWLGRFFQEAGMKVIPRLQFDYNDPDSLDIALRGIPQNCPILATSQQNVEDKANEPKITKHLDEALAIIKPKTVLYYSGPPGKRCMEATKYKGKVVYLDNYAAVRRNTVFDKADGIKGEKRAAKANPESD